MNQSTKEIIKDLEALANLFEQYGGTGFADRIRTGIEEINALQNVIDQNEPDAARGRISRLSEEIKTNHDDLMHYIQTGRFKNRTRQAIIVGVEPKTTIWSRMTNLFKSKKLS